MFYQRVLAPLKHNIPVFVHIDNVPRAVNQLRVGFVQGILDKYLPCPLNIVIITHGKGRAAHAQFAIFAHHGKFIVLV
jgi:hypothetical protein